jgi:ubiquinone/menaquinone biosynthesis C-methylase UbiE
MILTHTVSRPAKYDDMKDLGMYRVLEYQGRLVIIDPHVPMTKQFHLADPAIIVDGSSNIVKNRFGRTTEEVARSRGRF